MNEIKLPEPAFRLRWKENRGEYTVSKPNIGDTDCYTKEQLIDAIEADRQARGESVCGAPINNKEVCGEQNAVHAPQPQQQASDLRYFCDRCDMTLGADVVMEIVNDFRQAAPQPQQTPEGYKQTIKEFFVALDAAMDLDKSCSTYSSKPKGTLTERVTAWGEVNRLRAMLEAAPEPKEKP